MKRRSGFVVMARLVGLVKPLTGYMLLAIVMGLVGHLCAAFITIFGGYAALDVLGSATPSGLEMASGAEAASGLEMASGAEAASGLEMPFGLTGVFVCVLVFAVLRAILRYAEQACNHFIAFKLLALIRDKVFQALRKLCPAKLEGRDKGDLIAVITSDIELLEVFYAHTISPVAIAFLFTVVMCMFIGSFHPVLGLLALLAYMTVGIAEPLITSRVCGADGMKFRMKSGELSAFVLDGMRGLSETLQYGQGERRLANMNAKTDELSEDERRIKRTAGYNMAVTNTVILLFDLAMLFVSATLYQSKAVEFAGVLIPTVALFSSFGPVIALANLGSTLTNTFAAGNRVLDILEEMPAVEEIRDGVDVEFDGARAEKVVFSYGNVLVGNDTGNGAGNDTGNGAGNDTGNDTGNGAGNGIGNLAGRPGGGVDGQTGRDFSENGKILDGVSFTFEPNKITGIIGKSGSGKSTLLKLLMRFWKTDGGRILISDEAIERINTANLRDMEGFVTQETHLFHDSIRNNLKIAKLDATDAEIEAACKKASVHDFIMSLPRGYDTPVGELGDTLSGGERQRIGLARAFLHDAPFLLLDEPTSNLDSLNEAVILKSLHEGHKDKAVVLVSHRESTMRIADVVYTLESGRMS